MKKVGILGGTFDPIHNGHIYLAKTALEMCGLDCVMFLPLNVPPHKKTPIATGKQRYGLISACIKNEPRFFLSDMELKRPGTTYTVDTLKAVKNAHKDWSIYYIIGTDTLKDLENWNNISQVFDLCTFVCMARPGVDSERSKAVANALAQRFGKEIQIIETMGKNVSSTAVRNASAREIERLVPREIAEDVKKIYVKETEKIERHQLLEKLKELISPERYKHSLNTETTAVELAKAHNCDVEKASLAAILHDCAKEISKDPIGFSKAHGIDKYLPLYEDYPLPILHAPMGAHLAKEEFGVDDGEILSAITWHTSGRANMSLLDKIIYMADYTEPSRFSTPEIEEIRVLSKTDLDTALCKALECSIRRIKAKGKNVHQDTLDAYDYIKNQLEKRVCQK